jgi:hypothetical protein
VWRPEARVSVLDSGFLLGDGVWEGLRASRGVLLHLHAHLDRLYEGAKALDMDIGEQGGEAHCLGTGGEKLTPWTVCAREQRPWAWTLARTASNSTPSGVG